MKQWLKKTLSLIIAATLCAGALAGCGKNQDDTESTSDIVISSDPNTLTIFYTTAEEEMVNKAKTLFKAQYSDITIADYCIDTQSDSFESQITALNTRMMAGNSPDVLLLSDSYTSQVDIYKVCLAGAFEDLTPYFDADDTWSWDGYNTAVIQGMQIGGQQSILPLTYDLTYFISEQELLEQSGFSMENCQTGKGLLEEFCRYYQETTTDGTKLPLFMASSYMTANIFDLMQCNPLDYDTQEVVWNVQTADFLQQFQSWYQMEHTESIPNLQLSTTKYFEQHLEYGDFLFLDPLTCQQYWSAALDSMQKITIFGTPVILPVYNYDGTGISAEVKLSAAVSRTSTHKQEAYEFIKCLLSEDVQKQSYTAAGSDSSYCLGSTPVNEAALKRMFSRYTVSSILTVGNTQMECAGIDSSLMEQYLALTHQINYSYAYNSSTGGNVEGYFANYLAGDESYDSAFQSADDRLSIYISE